MKTTRIALIYDFDKTLSPRDMQEFRLCNELGFGNPADFWKLCADNSKKHDVDGILSYMEMIKQIMPDMTRDDLIEEGKYVELYRGVDTWFKRINEYGQKNGVKVEHYIISSGLKEIVLGTKIAKEFKKIYACSYAYDSKGKILWPARLVNYTMKTQYLFRINKGILDETNDFDLNASTPENKKRIPFDHMIYFGDGLTDVPSMKVMQASGGYTIAVFGDKESKKELAEQLHKERGADFALEADYSKGSDIEKVVKAIIDTCVTKKRLDEYK